MEGTFLMLLTAHLVGDFILQNKSMVKAKDTRPLCLLFHAMLVTLATVVIGAVIAPNTTLFIYFWVFLAHFTIDWVKGLAGSAKWMLAGNSNNETWLFVTDQVAHLASLAAIAALFPGMAEQSLWLRWFPDRYFEVLIVISGIVACVFAGGILINKATRPLILQMSSGELNGLKNGGRIIGQLERGLTFFFMLTGQTNAIGFLFAAKSILRFGEIKDGEKRKEAEYIIIGTFMSFGWALLIGYLTQQALGR